MNQTDPTRESESRYRQMYINVRAEILVAALISIKGDM